MTTKLANLEALGRAVADTEAAYHRARLAADRAAEAERMAQIAWQRAKERLAAGVAPYGVSVLPDPTAPADPRSVCVAGRSGWWLRLVEALGEPY